jgi:hypothetical protein
MYQKEFGGKVSSWQFQKVIGKYQLYYDSIKAGKVRTKRKRNQLCPKIRINQVNPQDYISKEKPFFFCVDGITLYLPFGKRYIFTVINHFNKLGFSRTYTAKSSLSAFDSLLRLGNYSET